MDKFRKALKIFWILFRYDLPIWLMGLLTAWWPDNRWTIRWRGALHRPFIHQCGKGLMLARGVQLKSTNRMVIGNHVYFAAGVWLNAMGGMLIEDEVILGPYVVISTGTHQFKNDSVRRGGTIFERVTINKGTWIAAHATVRAGVTIGSGVIVAANAAVTKDVPNNVVVGGVPAAIIGNRKNAEDENTVLHSRFD